MYESTGECKKAEWSDEEVDKLLNNVVHKEVLFEKGKKQWFEEKFGNKQFIFELDDWIFKIDAAKDRLLKQFETKNLKGFGIDQLQDGISASGALLYYLDITKHSNVGHITSLSRIEEDGYVRLDKFTVRSLELSSTMNDGGTTLLNIIDKTVSPMGGRMLRRWILFPLKDVKPIEERLDVVEYFFRDIELRDELDSLCRVWPKFHCLVICNKCIQSYAKVVH